MKRQSQQQIDAANAREQEAQVTLHVTLCSVCQMPAHASETDDEDRCSTCRPKKKRWLTVRQWLLLEVAGEQKWNGVGLMGQDRIDARGLVAHSLGDIDAEGRFVINATGRTVLGDRCGYVPPAPRRVSGGKK
jgi:hypothetical protein